MDPKRVLTFRVVARERSFTRAAQELALSQPSVSHQVAALEQEVGARLLDRSPGGLRLTRAGTLLLEHADAIAARFDLASLQLAEIAEDERTLLRIGAFPTALAGLVPSAVAQVRVQHPGARVTVDEGAADELPDRVRSGALHLAVDFQEAALARREFDDLERHDLLREPFLVALPPDHKLAGQRAVRLSDLADEDWTAAFTDGLIVRACRAAGFEPRIVIITRDPLAAAALAAARVCVSIVPQLSAAMGLSGIVTPKLRGPAPRRSIYALVPESGAHPQAALLVDALRDAATV